MKQGAANAVEMSSPSRTPTQSPLKQQRWDGRRRSFCSDAVDAVNVRDSKRAPRNDTAVLPEGRAVYVFHRVAPMLMPSEVILSW